MKRPPCLHGESAGFPAAMGARCFKEMQTEWPCLAHKEGALGSGHSGCSGLWWSELDDGRMSCFLLSMLQMAAWRARAMEMLGREGGVASRQRQSRVSRSQEAGIPVHRAACEAGVGTLGPMLLL